MILISPGYCISFSILSACPELRYKGDAALIAFDSTIPKYILRYMNTKTTILIKVDKKIKAVAQKAAKDIGIPLGTVMGMYLRKFAQERRIEFEAPEIPNAKTARAIREAQKDFAAGRYEGPFDTAEDMIAALHKK